MKIRKATIEDLDEITKIEEICFPKTEAASRECFRSRLLVYPDYFWLIEQDGLIVTFINGMVTDEKLLLMKCLKILNSIIQMVIGKQFLE